MHAESSTDRLTKQAGRLLSALVLLAGFSSRTVEAQIIADTLFTWQAYAEHARCRLVLYRSADKTRPFTAVLDELATNKGPSTTADAAYLVDRIGRTFKFDPAEAVWIFRWSAASFVDSPAVKKKELLLRATFNRSKSGRLGSPSWRVVNREDVEAYTDRLLLPQRR